MFCWKIWNKLGFVSKKLNHFSRIVEKSETLLASCQNKWWQFLLHSYLRIFLMFLYKT